jgi:serine/threonine-protein kinase
MGIMCIFGIVLSAVGAHVLYGLRETARHALQLGQYTLLDKIGEGGMGVVYLAQHALLRRPTAVKLLPPGRASPNDVERFEREVQLTSLLTHPNTVAIYDYGRTPDGVFYYAMEYLDGFSLDELVRLTGPQPPGRIIHILRQALRALAEAHGLGIIHRDIKPANILLCERGGVYDFVKVVDFGLVKELESESDARGNATEITAIIGTPHYISPEAIRSPSELDPRSDLYALGAVGYFLLTGKPPFDGNTLIEIYSHHLHTNVAWPARPVPESPSDDLEAVLRACLAKAQKDRPRDAATCLALLDQCRNAHAWGPREAHAWWMEHGALRRRRQLNPDPEAQTLPMASRTFSPQRKAS